MEVARTQEMSRMSTAWTLPSMPTLVARRRWRKAQRRLQESPRKSKAKKARKCQLAAWAQRRTSRCRRREQYEHRTNQASARSTTTT